MQRWREPKAHSSYARRWLTAEPAVEREIERHRGARSSGETASKELPRVAQALPRAAKAADKRVPSRPCLIHESISQSLSATPSPLRPFFSSAANPVAAFRASMATSSLLPKSAAPLACVALTSLRSLRCGRQVSEENVIQMNTKANRLRWMLKDTMGAAGEFERRREELSVLDGGRHVSEAETVASFVDSVRESYAS